MKRGRQFVEILANNQGRSSRGPVILHGASASGPQQAHLRALGLTSLPLHESDGLLPVKALPKGDQVPGGFNSTTVNPRHELIMVRNGLTIAQLAKEAESDVPEMRGYTKNNAEWYHHGHEHAAAIGSMLGHGPDTAHEVGAGILASLSGNGTDWESANIPAAYAVARHVVQNRDQFLDERSGIRKVAASMPSLKGIEKGRVLKAVQIARASGDEDHYTSVLGDVKEGTFADNLAYPSGDSPYREGPVKSTIDKQYFDALTAYKRPWATRPPEERREWDPTPTDIKMGLGAKGRYDAMNRVSSMVASRARSIDPSYDNSIAAQSGIWVAFKDMHDPKSEAGRAFHGYLSKRFPMFQATSTKFGSRRPDAETGMVYRDNPQQQVLTRSQALRQGLIEGRA